MSNDDERIDPSDPNRRVDQTRGHVLLALAQADGQAWKTIAEASEHTGEMMYGKQADAMIRLMFTAGLEAVDAAHREERGHRDWRAVDDRKAMLRVTEALGTDEPRAWEGAGRIVDDYILPAIERLRGES